jgi:protoheme IX farnesyltransferase
VSRANLDSKTLGGLLSASGVLLVLGMALGGLGLSQSLNHQISVVIGGGILAASLLVGFRHIWKIKPLRNLLLIGFLALLAQAILGQLLLGDGWSVIARGFHFSFSVIVLASVSASAGLLYISSHDMEDRQLVFQERFSRQALIFVVLVFFALISGVFLAESGLGFSCENWPLCDSFWLPSGLLWIPVIHRVMVGLVGIFLIRFTLIAWRIQREEKLVLTFVTSLTILFFGQAFIGALLSLRGNVDNIGLLHSISAAMIVVVGSLLVIVLGLREKREISWEWDRGSSQDRRQRFKDFLTLNKPIVVLLLLSTTLGGMVMGAKGFPSFRVVFVTMISGALAAGGSGAVNQFLDKDLDQKMTRTSKRPIPAGRLTPAEGLAYGIGALLISFYLMAGLVNMLAALLSLAGMVYYVFLYSIMLKKRTVQNIVIGGGAGAIPPLVGWAAGTGSLNLTAGFLFLIIFLWTPPHFWALALTRKNEYATAGVPMMPVERGEAITQRLIFVYTVILVVVTLVMWGLGLAGWLYLAAAVILGTYLVWLAWQVFKIGRNKIYYRMYKHSNYYLLLLFVFMAADSMLR